MLLSWIVLSTLASDPSVSSPTSELPQWVKVLNPRSSARLRWIERFEKGYESSGLHLRLRAGAFPQLHPRLSAGFELSTRADDAIEVPLGNRMGNKDIGLSQAFVRFHTGDTISLNMILGKFESPTLTSPLLFAEEIFPEGAFESLSLKSEAQRTRLALYAAQYALDQQAASSFQGLGRERSWLFKQGIHFKLDFASASTLRLAFNSYYFLDPSEELVNLSAQRGNSYSGSIGSNADLINRYLPLEAVVQLEGQPLGLAAEGTLAGALNPRSSDKHRSLYAELSLGNKWKASRALVTLIYFYHEPDTTISYFSEESLGFSNRHGAKASVAFFPLSFLKLSSSYLYAIAIAKGPLQGRRHEIRFESEVRF